jgi:hypothetical protein
MWDQAQALIFDETRFAGRYAGTLTVQGGQSGSFAINGLQPGNEVWMVPEFYNISPGQIRDMTIYVSGSTIIYNLTNVPTSVVVQAVYGWK